MTKLNTNLLTLSMVSVIVFTTSSVAAQEEERLTAYLKANGATVEKLYGNKWLQNPTWMIRSIDRRHGTEFETELEPIVIPASKALELLRAKYGGKVFKSQSSDDHLASVAKVEGSIAVVYEFPDDNPKVPDALTYVPFPKTHYDDGSVGLGDYVGLDHVRYAKTDAELPMKSKKNRLVHVKSLKEIEEEEAVVMMVVPGCSVTKARTPYVVESVYGKERRVYVVEIANVDWVHPKYVPVRAGPVLTLMRPKEKRLLDVQYMSRGRVSAQNFFARVAGAKQAISKVKGKLTKKESRERLWRSLSALPSIESTDLSEQNLGWTSFRGTIFSGSDFSNVDATQTKFENVYIYHSNFQGAKLPPNTKNVLWVNSICPNGTKSDPATMTCGQSE